MPETLDSTSRRNATPRIDPVTPVRPWRFMPHPRGENLSGIHWYLVKPLVTVSPHFIAAGAVSCFHRRRVGASNATAQAATAPRSRRVDRNGLIQNTLGAQARLSRT